MSYQLKEITIRTNNAEESKKADLWSDIENGKIPLLFNSKHEFLHGLSPVSKYSNYDKELKDYDFSIIAVESVFFKEMEAKVLKGDYIKIETSDENGNEQTCAEKAWQIVSDKENTGLIKRNYIEDFESSVPREYTKDGKAHCYLYIGVK